MVSGSDIQRQIPAHNFKETIADTKISTTTSSQSESEVDPLIQRALQKDSPYPKITITSLNLQAGDNCRSTRPNN